MKKMVCKDYRKLNAIMKKFLEQASSDLTYTTICLPSYNELKEMGLTFEEAFFEKDLWTEVESKKDIVLRKYNRFSACLIDPEIVRINYNIEELFSRGSKQFRKDITFRSPMTKGFADITLTLLHELGHHATEDFDFGNYDREEMLKDIRQTFPRELVNFAYFLLPDEYAATEWAIDWLKNAKNRKIAKKFEKEFFKLFEKPLDKC